jgi:hypothetical protein
LWEARCGGDTHGCGTLRREAFPFDSQTAGEKGARGNTDQTGVRLPRSIACTLLSAVVPAAVSFLTIPTCLRHIAGKVRASFSSLVV